METIEERAKEYADRHKETEINYFGIGKVYGYSRIYNAEITAYEMGAKEQKAIDEEVRLKKSDDMTQEEYDREVAFADWYHQNGKGTPTYSDAIEWARKEVIENARDWFSDYLIMEICDANDWLRGSPETGEDRFRKAMEE